MNHTAGIMTASVQKATKGVLHASGGGRVDVALDCWAMNDVFAPKKCRNPDAIRINIDALVRTHTYVKTDEKCITKTRV